MKKLLHSYFRANALKFPIFGFALLLEFLIEMGARGTPINRA